MRCPVKLDGEAGKFWDSNQLRLEKDGLLTADTVHGFVVMCKLWAVIQGTDPYDSKQLLRFSSAVKQFSSYAKEFGMLPAAAKKSGLKKEENLLDSIKLMMRDDAATT